MKLGKRNKNHAKKINEARYERKQINKAKKEENKL